MTEKEKKRRRDRSFVSFIVIPANGDPPYRSDGKPMTKKDFAMLRAEGHAGPWRKIGAAEAMAAPDDLRGTSVAVRQAIANAYQARFPNWDQISHPSIIWKPRFVALLRQATREAEPLTRAKIESVFGEIGWEE